MQSKAVAKQGIFLFFIYFYFSEFFHIKVGLITLLSHIPSYSATTPQPEGIQYNYGKQGKQYRETV